MLRRLAWWMPFATFTATFLWLLHARWPMVGVDFRYFIPRLIDGRWHAAINGPLPFRYTPHFCGGLPQYGNPQDMFYSLPQALTLVMDPWIAVVISIVAALAAGYAGWWRFGRDVLRCSAAWSHVLALVLTASGYFFVHMIVGHLPLLLLPLLGWLLWLLLDPRRDTATVAALRGGGVAIIVAVRLSMGGFIPLLLDALVLLTGAPILLLLACGGAPVARLRTVAMRCAWASAMIIGLCASKLTAIGSMILALPRSMDFARFGTETSAVAYLARTLWGMPQRGGLFAGPYSVLHENSVWLSPVTLVGLPCAAVTLWMLARNYRRLRAPIALATAYAAGGLLLTMQLVRGYGWFADAVHGLPVFSSQHVATRFAYIPMIAVGLLSIWGLERCMRRLGRPASDGAAAGALVVTVACFALAFATPARHEFQLFYNYDTTRTLLRDHGGPPPAVSRMTLRGDDTAALFEGASLIRCYEPLIHWASYPAATHLREAPASDIRDGAFNVADPRCYSAGSGCAPGTPLALSEAENAARFLRGEPTGWALPWWQRLADAVTLGTLAAMIIALTALIAYAWRQETTST